MFRFRLCKQSVCFVNANPPSLWGECLFDAEWMAMSGTARIARITCRPRAIRMVLTSSLAFTGQGRLCYGLCMLGVKWSCIGFPRVGGRVQVKKYWGPDSLTTSLSFLCDLYRLFLGIQVKAAQPKPWLMTLSLLLWDHLWTARLTVIITVSHHHFGINFTSIF